MWDRLTSPRRFVLHVWALIAPAALGGVAVAAFTGWSFTWLDALRSAADAARAEASVGADLEHWTTKWVEAVDRALAAERPDVAETRVLADFVLRSAEEVIERDLPGENAATFIAAFVPVGAVTGALGRLETDPPAARIEARARAAEALGAGREGLLSQVTALHRDATRAVVQAQADLDSGRRRIRAALGFLALGYGLVLIYLVFWSRRSLVKPTRALTVNARRVTEHFAHQVEPLTEGPAELIELSQAFSTLVERLQRSKSDIERQVRDRTAELVAANRAKTEFLANMSHEIRTPMTAILGFVELLREEGRPEAERSEFLRTIHRNGRHLLEIINQILDLSALEVGRIELHRSDVSPAQLVSDIHALLLPRARAKSLDFDVDVADQVPDSILTDPTRLRQILVNLVGNAIKFTERGHVRVRVEAGPGTPKLLFRVSDSGIGLGAEQIEKVFQDFTQVDGSHTRRHGGTGLGLAISQRLARCLGGDVRVESRPGAGSCFTLSLPLDSASRSRATRATKPEEAHASEPAPTELRGRVLLVEDGADNRRLLAFLLRRMGLEVETAENGRDGVDQAWRAVERGEAFDVILMDIQMPVLDGYAATGELRTYGYGGAIVALTAHAMEGDRERCLDAGCDEFLTKPVDRDALARLLARYLPKEDPAQARR